jgi:hypothetical protein
VPLARPAIVAGGALAASLGGRATFALAGAGALLVLAIAAVFDLLFLAVDELPATVPVAVAAIALTVTRGPGGTRLAVGDGRRAGALG